MKKLVFTSIFVLTSLSAQAQLKSQKALTTSLQTLKFSASLVDGFHFNDKAPNEIKWADKKIKPQLLKARKIEFTLPSQAWKDGEASLYVCDDEITYCETHIIPLSKSKKKSNSGSTGKLKKKTEVVHGFLINDFAEALKSAKKSKKLILADFSARWCPGCVRLENEIFPTKEFAKLSQNLVKVKVDVDLYANFDLAEKYNIVGIPTLMILSPEGKEVDRIVDFQPIDRLKVFITSIEENPTPLQDLLAKVEKKSVPKDLKTLALRLVASGQFEKSLAYFEKLDSKPPEYLHAKIMAAEIRHKKNPKTKDQYIATLKESIASEPESTRSISWRSSLIPLLEQNSSEAKAIYQEGLRLSDALLKDSRKLTAALATDAVGEFTGYEKFMLSIYRALLVESFETDPTKVTTAWRQAADVGTNLKIPANHLGSSLRLLIVFGGAKMWAEGEKLANEMLVVDPKNTDIKRRKLRFLMEQEKYQDAIPLGEEIIDLAEDRNQIWVAESLAKAYIGAQNKSAARKLITAYLARPEMKLEKMKNSKKSLEELLSRVHL